MEDKSLAELSSGRLLGRSYGLSKIALAVVFLFLPLMTRGMMGRVAICEKYKVTTKRENSDECN